MKKRVNKARCPKCDNLVLVKGTPIKIDVVCKKCGMPFSAQRIYRKTKRG